MKINRFLVLAVLLLFFLNSCEDIVDGIVDKVCDVGVKEIRDDYNGQISQIQNNPDLSQQEKEDQIEALTIERDDEVELFKSDCSL